MIFKVPPEPWVEYVVTSPRSRFCDRLSGHLLHFGSIKTGIPEESKNSTAKEAGSTISSTCNGEEVFVEKKNEWCVVIFSDSFKHPFATSYPSEELSDACEEGTFEYHHEHRIVTAAESDTDD